MPYATDLLIRIRTDVDDFTIHAEPHLMHRVFSNLFLNALQAMPDGETLTITSSNEGAVTTQLTDTGWGSVLICAISSSPR